MGGELMPGDRAPGGEKEKVGIDHLLLVGQDVLLQPNRLLCSLVRLNANIRYHMRLCNTLYDQRLWAPGSFDGQSFLRINISTQNTEET